MAGGFSQFDAGFASRGDRRLVGFVRNFGHFCQYVVAAGWKRKLSCGEAITCSTVFPPRFTKARICQLCVDTEHQR
jgi:hypothetical protein